MKSNTPPIQTDTYYHVYNRGINGMNIFNDSTNYLYFLNKYNQYITPVADTFAYCLLKNHFHLLIKTRSAHDIINVATNSAAEETISRQFAHLFNSYAQGFNKLYKRTGGLFETPFRRIEIGQDTYFSSLIFYIHYNPQRHRLCDDYKKWPYSSYNAYVSHLPTKIKRDEGLAWFGGLKQLINFHEMQATQLQQNEIFEMEFD